MCDSTRCQRTLRAGEAGPENLAARTAKAKESICHNTSSFAFGPLTPTTTTVTPHNYVSVIVLFYSIY